ncbi:histidine kinase [Duganella sp. BJB1802]|uniref:sensor histidine kinase n=1 Tax=Duganella sp. BJB1802 TaxID=2744575 RepID=UPI0015932D6E|nr:histidine kinase [Duganella sp. BJB1802]NVD74847.1 histidine kinase [Duganella sp. BJB1802]
MRSPPFLPFNAPAVPEVGHDRRLVRRYLLQSALRFNAGSLLFLSLAIALLPLWLKLGPAAPGDVEARKLTPYIIAGAVVLAVMIWLALMSSGIARGFLARLVEEGKALSAEAMASSVTRRIDAPFNPLTTFDLCTESLSGLALGTALGYSGPPAFFHDPFKGRIVLGRWRPLTLGRHVEVRVSSDLGPSCHIDVRCRPGLAWFTIQQGESLKTAELVSAQLRQHLARHASALDAARRERELERTSLQARLSALQAQVEPHFLFNTLANLKYLIRTDQHAAQDMLDHLVGYLQNAMPDMRSVSSTLGREMDLVSDYLAVMRIRMGARLRFAVEVAEELRGLPFPPAMLISLVENAVKHGLERASRPGLITIGARHESDGKDGLLIVSVVDDGVGLTEQAGQGTGLANITERLLLLYGRKASLFVEPGDAHGVRALLTVPIVGSPA